MAQSESRRLRREYKRRMVKQESKFKKQFLEVSKETHTIPMGEKAMEAITEACKAYVTENYSKHEVNP